VDHSCFEVLVEDEEKEGSRDVRDGGVQHQKQQQKQQQQVHG
jgi:hypothetical protein